MAGMSVSTGLVSGIDYDTMIGQLMQVEANPQTLLKQQLSATNADATAYRAVNTRFDALRTAAAALTDAPSWHATKATSSSTTVTATSQASAASGSLTFSADTLATTHAVFSSGTWPSGTTVLSATDPTTLTLAAGDGDRPATTVTVPAGKPLAEAAQLISDSAAGVSAIVVNTGQGARLQTPATPPGAYGVFTVSADLAACPLTTGGDAQLTAGPGLL